MSSYGRASFLHVKDQDGGTVAKWQDYFPAALVNGHEFLRFETGGLEVDESGDQETLSVRLPDFERVAAITKAALANGYLAELTVWQFDQPTTLTDLPGTETQVGAFIGAIIDASRDFATIEWTVGNPLATVRSNVPGLLFTNRLVGVPCRI